MMIAIPNTNKPKSCKECIDDMFNVVVDCYPDEYGEDRDGNKIICPLIDIVECWECEYYRGHEEYCDNDYFAKEHGFCFYGNREKDEL